MCVWNFYLNPIPFRNFVFIEHPFIYERDVGWPIRYVSESFIRPTVLKNYAGHESSILIVGYSNADFDIFVIKNFVNTFRRRISQLD